jgi:hypothetical protein
VENRLEWVEQQCQLSSTIVEVNRVLVGLADAAEEMARFGSLSLPSGDVWFSRHFVSLTDTISGSSLAGAVISRSKAVSFTWVQYR